MTAVLQVPIYLTPLIAGDFGIPSTPVAPDWPHSSRRRAIHGETEIGAEGLINGSHVSFSDIVLLSAQLN